MTEEQKIDYSSVIQINSDIREHGNYETRNRTFNPANPYFITPKGPYTAGVLVARTPGSNTTQQKSYLANLLGIPKTSSHLINTTFYNGNSWFTINFKLEEDLQHCINKINQKRIDDFKFIEIDNPEGPAKPKKQTNTL